MTTAQWIQRLPQLRIRSRTERIRWVNVRVFDAETGSIYRDQITETAAIAELTPRCRYRPDTEAPRYIGALFGLLAAVVFFYLLFIGVGFLPAMALTMAAMTGAVIGAPAGFMLGPRFGPQPYYLIRRVMNAGGKYEHLPVIHSSFEEREWRREKRLNDDDEEVEVTVPYVVRASTYYEDMQARDERDYYKGKGGSWEKIELDLMAAAVIALVVLVILYAIILQDQPPPA